MFVLQNHVIWLGGSNLCIFFGEALTDDTWNEEAEAQMLRGCTRSCIEILIWLSRIYICENSSGSRVLFQDVDVLSFERHEIPSIFYRMPHNFGIDFLIDGILTDDYFQSPLVAS